VAPIQQRELLKVAQSNRDAAVAFAEANGYDVETIKEHFDGLMAAPNGVAMLADQAVAQQAWRTAVGLSVERGKIPTPKPRAAAPSPSAIPAAPAGRRTPAAAAIQLSPAVEKVYRDAGVDPHKTPAATKPVTADAHGYVTLE
jgi:hypothetical protein